MFIYVYTPYTLVCVLSWHTHTNRQTHFHTYMKIRKEKESKGSELGCGCVWGGGDVLQWYVDMNAVHIEYNGGGGVENQAGVFLSYHIFLLLSRLSHLFKCPPSYCLCCCLSEYVQKSDRFNK